MPEQSPLVTEVWNSTYQISTYDRDSDLTFNQYVISDDRPLLVHTGSVQHFDSVIEGLTQVCSLNDLEYVLITHFESDECGSLAKFLDRNPDLTPVCSDITARQLDGFGIHHDPIIKQGGETLDLGSRTLEFLDYPAEMHLWNGVLGYDRTHDGLFSSDLFIQRGAVTDAVVAQPVSLKDIPHDRIREPEAREKVGERLSNLSPRRLAPGHGPVLERTSE